jgi:hypothetical protein
MTFANGLQKHSMEVVWNLSQAFATYPTQSVQNYSWATGIFEAGTNVLNKRHFFLNSVLYSTVQLKHTVLVYRGMHHAVTALSPYSQKHIPIIYLFLQISTPSSHWPLLQDTHHTTLNTHNYLLNTKRLLWI